MSQANAVSNARESSFISVQKATYVASGFSSPALILLGLPTPRLNGMSLHQLSADISTPNIFVFKEWILPTPLSASETDWK